MIVLRVKPGLSPARALADIKSLSSLFPGEHELEIRVAHRTLRLGRLWRYDGSPECMALLGSYGAIEEVTNHSQGGV